MLINYIDKNLICDKKKKKKIIFFNIKYFKYFKRVHWIAHVIN